MRSSPASVGLLSIRPVTILPAPRARAELKDARIHDLRHTFASAAVAAGQGRPMIGKLRGHIQVQTTVRYAHPAADPVKAAAERVTENIAAALG